MGRWRFGVDGVGDFSGWGALHGGISGQGGGHMGDLVSMVYGDTAKLNQKFHSRCKFL